MLAPDGPHDACPNGPYFDGRGALGVSTVAVNKRSRQGRLPFVEKVGRRGFRRDHPELVHHADVVKRPANSRPALEG